MARIVCLFSIQAFSAPLYNSFNAGELSPLVQYRVDMDARYMGAQMLENMLVKPQGTAIRRPGTRYVTTTKDNGEARLIPFEFSTTDTYILEFGEEYVRFFRDTTAILSGTSPYEITSPYTADQLREIHYIQSNDVMYLVHPDVPPYKLSRYDHDEWTLEQMEFYYPVFKDTNTDPSKKIKCTFYVSSLPLWADATAYEYGDMVKASSEKIFTCIIGHTSDASDEALDEPTATDSHWYYYADNYAGTWESQYIERGAPVKLETEQANIFTADMVGTYFKLISDTTQTIFSDSYADSDPHTTDAFRVFGTWKFSTSGTWNGECIIQRSDDFGNNWTNYRTISSASAAESNYSISGQEVRDDIFYRITTTLTAGSMLIDFQRDDYSTDGYVLLTSLVSTSTIPDGNDLSTYTDIIAHYTMNDNAATAVVLDSSGNDYSGTLKKTDGGYGDYNTSNVYDAVNYKVNAFTPAASASFENSNGTHLIIPADVVTDLGTTSRTVSFWFRPDDAPTSGFSWGACLLWIGDTHYNRKVNFSILPDMTLRFVDTAGSHKAGSHKKGSHTADDVLVTETWYHCALVFRSDKTEIYLNGMKIIQSDTPVTFVATDKMAFGADMVSASAIARLTTTFDGNVDNLSFYTGSMSGADIAAFLGGAEAYGIVKRPIFDGETPDGATAYAMQWSESAFSPNNGYPRAISFYQNRLCLAGNDYMPNGVWISQSSDYENFRLTTEDNGAIFYEIGGAKQNPILWLQDKNGIIAGTSGSVIRIFGQENGGVITASNIGSEVQFDAGSSTIQAVPFADSILFVDRNNKRVRDMVYDLQSDGFVSPDLTILAEHVTSPGVVEVAVQNRPDTMAWFVRSDGEIAVLTRERNQQVTAWTRQTTDGDFESIAIIPGTDEDQIWTIVNRTIGGAEKRYIEYFESQNWGDDQEDCWFVDSGIKRLSGSTETSSVTKLTHLEGEDVVVFTGTTYQESTVSGGAAAVDPKVTNAIAGLPFTSRVVTFPIEIQTAQGYSVGLRKKIYQIVMLSYESMPCQYGEYGNTLFTVDFTTYPDTYTGTTEPYSGLIRLPYDSGWKDETQIELRQEAPYPMGVSGLVTKVEVAND